MTTALTAFDQAITDDTCGRVRIATRHGDQWISVPRMEPLPEPVRLEQIKAEVQRTRGTIDLLDVLKDSDVLCDFTDEFVSTAQREIIDRETLQRRLLLTLFALGTNMGIKAVVSTGEHAETEQPGVDLHRSERSGLHCGFLSGEMGDFGGFAEIFEHTFEVL